MKARTKKIVIGAVIIALAIALFFIINGTSFSIASAGNAIASAGGGSGTVL